MPAYGLKKGFHLWKMELAKQALRNIAQYGYVDEYIPAECSNEAHELVSKIWGACAEAASKQFIKICINIIYAVVHFVKLYTTSPNQIIKILKAVGAKTPTAYFFPYCIFTEEQI